MSGFEHIFDFDGPAVDDALLTDTGIDLFDSLLQELDEEVLGADPASLSATTQQHHYTPAEHYAPTQHYATLAEHGDPFAHPLASHNASTQLYSTYAGVPVPPQLSDNDTLSLSSAELHSTTPSPQSTQAQRRPSHKRKAAPTPYPSQHPPTHHTTHAQSSQHSLTTQSSSSSSAGAAAVEGTRQSHANTHAPPPAQSALTQLPVSLCQAFNAGDMQSLRALVTQHCTPQCALRTTGLGERAMSGREWVCTLFQALADTHPDGVFVAKHCELQLVSRHAQTPASTQHESEDGDNSNDNNNNSNNGSSSNNNNNSHSNMNSSSANDTQQDSVRWSVQARIYFAGTRLAPLLPTGQNAPAQPAFPHEFLFHRPQSSLTSLMDTSALAKSELAAMQELERRATRLSVFFKGTLSLALDANAQLVEEVQLLYEVSSFRDADFLC